MNCLLLPGDGKTARLLREHNIRTMDIAKMMNISERSVTRLLAKFKADDIIYDQTIVEQVEKLLADKDSILNGIQNCQLAQPPIDEDIIGEGLIYEEVEMPNLGSKFNLCANLLSMKTKVKDIAKMLDISEQKVLRWKAKWRNQKANEDHYYGNDESDYDSEDED